MGIFVDTGSPHVVILCHGYMANYTFCQFPALAAGLAEAGFSSFRFDHPCAFRGQSELKGDFKMGNHDDEVADMAAAAEFLRKEKGLTVLALLGHSKGGTNVIKYAAERGDIPNMINLSGRFCVRDGVLQRVRSKSNLFFVSFWFSMPVEFKKKQFEINNSLFLSAVW